MTGKRRPARATRKARREHRRVFWSAISAGRSRKSAVARGIRPHVARIAVRQVEGEEVRLLLDAADHHQRLADVRLRVAGRVVQRHEHLAAAALMLTQVCLHDGVAAGEPCSSRSRSRTRLAV